MLKEIKLKFRKGLILMFVEVSGGKLVGEVGPFCSTPSPILNRDKFKADNKNFNFPTHFCFGRISN